MQEGAFQRKPLTHATREGRHRLGASVVQGRVRQRRGDDSLDIRDPIEPREECQVLRRGQLRIEIEVVAENTNPRPQSRSSVARVCGLRRGLRLP